MGCRGVLFAISDVTVKRLLAAISEAEVLEIVDEIEESWDKEFLCQTDKAWDAMHRALSDGSLDLDAGSFPLNRAILGGHHLCSSGDYYVSYVPKSEVPAVAKALAAIDEPAMAARYDHIVPRDYAIDYGDEDRDYTLGYFLEVVAFYQRAADAGRAVIFTVDQ